MEVRGQIFRSWRRPSLPANSGDRLHPCRFIVNRRQGRPDAEEHASGLFTELSLACIGELFTHPDQICG